MPTPSSRFLKSAALSILTGLFAFQIYKTATATPAVEPIDVLVAGDSVPQIYLTSLTDGTQQKAADVVSAPCHVFYFFGPSCRACEIGAPHWSKMEKLTGMAEVGVTWIATSVLRDSIKEFTKKYAIRFPIFLVDAEEPKRKLGVNAIPAVWLIEDSRIHLTTAGALLTSPDSLSRKISTCILKANR